MKRLSEIKDNEEMRDVMQQIADEHGRGEWFVNISNTGSFYWQYRVDTSVKVRLSGHSVTSYSRLMNEVHFSIYNKEGLNDNILFEIRGWFKNFYGIKNN